MSTKKTATVHNHSTITVKLFEHGGQAALVSVSGKIPEREALMLAMKAIAGYLIRKRNRILTQ